MDSNFAVVLGLSRYPSFSSPSILTCVLGADTGQVAAMSCLLEPSVTPWQLNKRVGCGANVSESFKKQRASGFQLWKQTEHSKSRHGTGLHGVMQHPSADETPD